MYLPSQFDIVGGIVYHSTQQWMTLHSQTVRGLTVYRVDAFTTWYDNVGWQRLAINQNHSNGQTVGGWSVYCKDAFTTWYLVGKPNLSFITTADDYEWADSRRVEESEIKALHAVFSGKHAFQLYLTINDTCVTDLQKGSHINTIMCTGLIMCGHTCWQRFAMFTADSSLFLVKTLPLFFFSLRIQFTSNYLNKYYGIVDD